MIFLPVSRFRLTCLAALVWVCPSLQMLASGDEIGFLERFALAENRQEAIAELVPGSADFYYFSALLAQLEGRLGDVDGILEDWTERHGPNPAMDQILRRQALLLYSSDPEASLKTLSDQLGLLFDHVQRRPDAEAEGFTEVDPAKISWEAFLALSLQPFGSDAISDSGVDRIIREGLAVDPRQRREFLGRLKYPDSERLVGLIAADLRAPGSGGFGSLGIHGQLTMAQLDELLPRAHAQPQRGTIGPHPHAPGALVEGAEHGKLRGLGRGGQTHRRSCRHHCYDF